MTLRWQFKTNKQNAPTHIGKTLKVVIVALNIGHQREMETRGLRTRQTQGLGVGLE